jgi:serine/threonine protein kinase
VKRGFPRTWPRGVVNSGLPVADSTPGAPQTFGPYQLISRLGKGGMGETWRAVRESHSGVTKELVIKRILRVHSANERFRQSFVNEARLSARLSHGNVCQVFDFGEVEGELYMAMEYVHGRPLSALLERAEELGLPVIPIPVATFIAIEMLKGLAHAHQRTDEKGRPLDIVHRDISPDNVMVSFEGEVKILDFGIARARLEGRADTSPGIVKGKLMYLSPEQAAAKPLDGRSDVWATGLVLYRMLSGKLAADHFDAARVIYELAQGKFRPLSEIAPWVPTALGEAAAKALKVDLAQRHASAKAFGHDLALYLHRAAPATGETTLSGVMASLFSRELYDEGKEVTIAPEVHALLDEARKMVAMKPVEHVQTRPGIPAVPQRETTGNLETLKPGTPAMATPKPLTVSLQGEAGPEPSEKDTQPIPDLPPERGPVPAPAGASAPTVTGRSGIPRWFLAVCALVGAGIVAGVLLVPHAEEPTTTVIHELRPGPDAPSAPTEPVGLPDWKRKAEAEVAAKLKLEREQQAAIEAQQNDPETKKNLEELDAQLKALNAAEEELRVLKVAAAQGSKADAANAKKIETLEKQNAAMKAQISAINAKLDTKKVQTQAAAERAQAGTGHLTLTTVNPAHATVYVDGQPFGETPMFKVPIEGGTHSLRIRAADQKLRALSLKIEAGKTLELKGINVEQLPAER